MKYKSEVVETSYFLLHYVYLTALLCLQMKIWWKSKDMLCHEWNHLTVETRSAETISSVAVVGSGRPRWRTGSRPPSGRPSAAAASAPVQTRDTKTDTTWTQSPSTRTSWCWTGRTGNAATPRRTNLWPSAAPASGPKPARTEPSEPDQNSNRILTRTNGWKQERLHFNKKIYTVKEVNYSKRLY